MLLIKKALTHEVFSFKADGVDELSADVIWLFILRFYGICEHVRVSLAMSFVCSSTLALFVCSACAQLLIYEIYCFRFCRCSIVVLVRKFTYQEFCDFHPGEASKGWQVQVVRL